MLRLFHWISSVSAESLIPPNLVDLSLYNVPFQRYQRE
jgi:hypothetical protein